MVKISTSEEKIFMKLAFDKADQHLGSTKNNPSVGCVVVKNNSVISSACTSVSGRPHAEFNALKSAANFDKYESDKSLKGFPFSAKNIIDTKDLNTESRPLDKGLYDGAVDTVGGNVLSKILSHIKETGIVAACGNALGIKLNTTVMPFIIRGVKLWGINSVNTSIKRREFLWNEAANLIDFELLNKSIKEIKLDDL